MNSHKKKLSKSKVTTPKIEPQTQDHSSFLWAGYALSFVLLIWILIRSTLQYYKAKQATLEHAQKNQT